MGLSYPGKFILISMALLQTFLSFSFCPIEHALRLRIVRLQREPNVGMCILILLCLHSVELQPVKTLFLLVLVHTSLLTTQRLDFLKLVKMAYPFRLITLLAYVVVLALLACIFYIVEFIMTNVTFSAFLIQMC